MLILETLLSFDPAVLATFALAVLLLNATPGADFLLVTTTAINGGFRMGIAASVGVHIGVLVHLAMAVAGMAALLAAYPWTYDAIRYAGAAYLAWMAWRAWRDSGAVGPGRPALSARAAVGRGFMTNVLNPKTALFIFAFLPQFADPQVGPVWPQLVVLGAIFFVNGFLFEVALSALAGRLGPLLRRHIRILNKLTAILFGGLAVRLAT